MVNEIITSYGSIDIAILNIGMGPPSNTLTASCETILNCMRTNYDTLIRFYCPIIKQMQQQNTRCMIAHMNSLATYFGIPMLGDYAAAKGAGRLFLETARMELKHFKKEHIIIQTIHPGFVDTEVEKDYNSPTPNRISEEKAAQYVLKGIKSEVRENRFPRGTALATRMGRLAPWWLLRKVLLSETLKDY